MIAAAGVGFLVMAGGGTWWLLQQHSPSEPTAQTPPPVIGTAAPQPPAASTPPATAQVAPPATAVAPPSQQQSPPPSPPVASQPPPVTTPSTPPPPPTPPVAVQTPPVTPPPQPVAQLPPQQPVAPPQPKQPATQSPPALPVAQPQPPPNPPVAFAGLDALRQQIAQWASNRRCALLQGDVQDGGTVTLAGFAGTPVTDELRQSLAGIVPPGQVDWGVRSLDPVFCPALDVLHPIAPGIAASGTRLGLGMADGKTRLRDGELVRLRLTMPDFASRLRVDYIAHDGSVQHLYPQLADPKVGLTADPPRSFAAGEAVPLGHPAWTIGEPYGTDMIIAVASSEPLFDKPRPGNAETADVYLRDLRAAVDAARQRGVHLAGAAVTLDALPK
jgi:hypothetical protein